MSNGQVRSGKQRSWWRWWRMAGAAPAALVVALAAFAFRFNTLGGALGGFDNDHFIYLARTDALLAGEQPLRDFVDAELRGAWPALSYQVSAWAQQIGGRTLLPEAYLAVGALALAHALVFLLVLDLSKRWTLAFLAAVTTVVMAPKLYNYPKVLMLTLGVWALRAAVAVPSTMRLGALAGATVAAALFRHDLGLYIAAPTILALMARDVGSWRPMLKSIGTYLAFTCVLVLPSLIWIQVYEGIPSYVANGLASVAAERARTPLRLPNLDLAAPLSDGNVLLVTYYATWAVPLLAGCALLLRPLLSPGQATARSDRALAFGLVVAAVLVNMSFLRANLAARFGDGIAPIVLLAACTVGIASTWTSTMARRVVTTLSFLLVAQMFAAAYAFSDVARELDTSGLSDSWAKTVRRFETVRADLEGLPAPAGAGASSGTTVAQRAAGYVARCTGPEDRLLVTGAIHEVLVLSRRRFAAGQAMFKLSLYTSERDQQRALVKLEQQSVPIVLADARESDDDFLSDYPLVAERLARDYRRAGTIAVDGEPGIVVLVEKARAVRHSDPDLGLPCFQ